MHGRAREKELFSSLGPSKGRKGGDYYFTL